MLYNTCDEKVASGERLSKMPSGVAQGGGGRKRLASVLKRALPTPLISFELAPIEDKIMRVNRLRWFSHIYRRPTGSRKEKSWCPKPLKEKDREQRKLRYKRFDDNDDDDSIT